MANVNLSTLIQQTQSQQKQDLEDFQQSINLSTQLKNASDAENPEARFVAQVLAAFAAGKQSELAAPADTTLAAMWAILLNNKDYIARLGAVDLPETGTADERLSTLVAYLNSHLKSAAGQETN